MSDISRSLLDITCMHGQFKERYMASYTNNINAVNRFKIIEDNVGDLEKTVERCQDIVKEIVHA